jgi:hypothetical protein
MPSIMMAASAVPNAYRFDFTRGFQDTVDREAQQRRSILVVHAEADGHSRENWGNVV